MKYLILLITLFSITTTATLNEIDKTNIFSKNLMRNGGFENGKALWTASAGTFAVTTTNPMIGSMHATWDAAASADTLVNTALTIPTGMLGRAGVASCLITTASGTATHSLQAYDGTNILSSTAILSSTIPTRQSTNFVFPSSGGSTIQLRIYANANEPSIAIDDCYIGPAEGFNVSNISQVQFIGSAYYDTTALCNWNRTSATVGDFNADTDCPAPTIEFNPGPGTISTTDADLPQITISNLPSGFYKVVAVGSAFQSAASQNSLTLSDGTTSSGYGTTVSNTRTMIQVEGIFSYSSAGSRTFKLQTASATSTTNLENLANQQRVYFYIYKYPSASEQAYKPDASAMSWSGYHNSTCSWARTNTAYGDPTADATCALVERSNQNFGTVSTSGSVLPAITFTPKRTGKYFVCATPVDQLSVAGATYEIRLWDGTTVISEIGQSNASNYLNTTPLCGIYLATSTSAVTLSLQTKGSSGTIIINHPSNNAIEWSIFAIDQSLPAPLLANGVVSPSSGVVKIASASIAVSGAGTITRQDGAWISSVGYNSAGDTTINISASTFSTTPNCVCSNIDGAAAFGCTIDPTTATSATLVRVQTFNSTVATDKNYNILCIGAP